MTIEAPHADNGGRMSERMLIVSSDGHVGAPAEQYRDYMDPRFRQDFDDWWASYVPMWLTKGTRARSSEKAALEHTMWGTEYQREFEARAARIPWGIEGKWDAARRLEAMDIDGVAADVMFPDDQSANSPPFLGLARDATEPWDCWSPAQRREGARAYNRWLADFCSHDPDRLLGVALIGSMVPVDDAIETVRWAKDHGLHGGLMLPVNYYNNVEPFWNDPGYDRLWAVCAELGMPLHTHVGLGSPYYSDDPFTGWLLWASESAFWVHRPLWFFVLGGVLERHPDLQLVFTEQGISWVPDALRMMDLLLRAKIMPFSEDERRTMFSLTPSEYFHRQCWIGATNTDALGWATSDDIAKLGTGRLMWGSDYPHMESKWPHTRETLRDLMKGIDEPAVEAMVAGNAIEAYGLDPSRLRPIADRIGPAREEIITV
jgi:predicted TIM-barrel fold metal-dependent hydrolase